MSETIAYAGFWRRFVAFLIDCALVSLLIFPMVATFDFFFPERMVVTTPFGLFLEEQVLESTPGTVVHEDGSVTATETRIVRKTYAGRWSYTYREVVKSMAGKQETESGLIDPVSGQRLVKPTTDTLEMLVLLLYLSLMEGSRHQASLGKMALGLRVSGEDGCRVTFLYALGRNAAKLLSVTTLFVGFMMAGWTARKQALHDKVARCVVILSAKGVKSSD